MDSQIGQTPEEAQDAQLRRILLALESNDFECPGGHWDVLGSQIEQEELHAEVLELQDRRDYYINNEVMERFKEVVERLKSLYTNHYLGRRECNRPITVVIEREGEYGEVSYPVAYGACAETLLLNDNDYEEPFWAAYEERKRLLAVLLASRKVSQVVT